MSNALKMARKVGAAAACEFSANLAKGSESSLRRAVAEYLDAAFPPHVWWTSIESAGRGKISGARMKREGVKRGTPDVVALIDKRFVAIELKTAKGKVSPEQREAHERITLAGGLVAICRSVDDVYGFLSQLVSLRCKPT